MVMSFSIIINNNVDDDDEVDEDEDVDDDEHHHDDFSRSIPETFNPGYRKETNCIT